MEPFEGKILMDGLNLSFTPGLFDLVLCVAVLHHMPTPDKREQMLRQINKVMRGDGKLVLTVLCWEAQKHIYPHSQDILLEYCVPNHRINKESNPKPSRIESKGEIYERYYHLF